MQKRKRTHKAGPARFLTFAAGITSAVVPASAIEPSDILIFSRDPVSIRPQLGISETYDDNLFYLGDEKSSDFITTISPGLDIQVGRVEGNYLLFNYTFGQRLYADRSDLNAGEHSFSLNSRFEGNRLALTGTDRVQLLSSPVGGREFVGVRNNVDRNSFFDNYTLSFAISEKTQVYVEGLYDEVDYESGVGLYDINTLKGTVGFGFKPLPKTTFFGEVYYGQTASTPNFDAPKNPYAEFIGGFIGARGDFTEKLTGTVKVGYEDFQFSDDTPTSNEPVASVSITHRPTEKTSINLSYSRLNSVSVQFARQSYTADIVSLGIGQVLGSSGKWRGSVNGSYGMYDYSETATSVARDDTLYTVSAGLHYAIQEWLSANLGYSFQKFERTGVTELDYNVNRVTLSLSVGY